MSLQKNTIVPSWFSSEWCSSTDKLFFSLLRQSLLTPQQQHSLSWAESSIAARTMAPSFKKSDRTLPDAIATPDQISLFHRWPKVGLISPWALFYKLRLRQQDNGTKRRTGHSKLFPSLLSTCPVLRQDSSIEQVERFLATCWYFGAIAWSISKDCSSLNQIFRTFLRNPSSCFKQHRLNNCPNQVCPAQVCLAQV